MIGVLFILIFCLIVMGWALLYRNKLFYIYRDSSSGKIDMLKGYADENKIDLDIHYCSFTKVWSVCGNRGLDIGFDVYLGNAIETAMREAE